MKSFRPQPRAVLSLMTVALLAAGCNNATPPVVKKADSADAAKPGDQAADQAIPGLKTEKEQVSYMIGMGLGKSLEPIKDEVNLDTVMKAARASLKGDKLLMTDEQAQKVNETFMQKMQAKQMAEMLAKSKENLEKGQKFLAENAKKPNVKTTASGLQYEVISEGTGPKPKATDSVKAHYKGQLLDGTVFDSSYDRGEPATFPLQQVVPGWTEGVQLMPVGSKYRFWLPPSLGYGERGPGPIGPNSTLVFEVELLEIVKPEQ